MRRKNTFPKCRLAVLKVVPGSYHEVLLRPPHLAIAVGVKKWNSPRHREKHELWGPNFWMTTESSLYGWMFFSLWLMYVSVCILCIYIYIYIYILYVPLFGEESDRRLRSGSVEYFWRGTSGSDICNFLGFGVQICLYPSTTSGKWKFTRPICESIYYFWGGKEGAASFTCQIPPPTFWNAPPRSLQDLNGSAANLSSGESWATLGWPH